MEKNSLSIKLSVVIPAYNEVKNLQSGVLDQVESFLTKQNYPYEVLIIDDESTDETADLIEDQIKNKNGFKLFRNSHGGKALTVISGMVKAVGEVVLFTDMDQATPLNQIEKFFPKFKEGSDIVIGLRTGRKGAPISRRISAWAFSILRNIILGLPFPDTQCGFKAFSQKAIKLVFPKMKEVREQRISKRAATNAGFDVEMLFYAKKLGLNIATVPVQWEYVETKRFNFLQDGIEAISDMIKIRMKNLRGIYG